MKITRENIADHLLEYQFNIIGRSIEEAINTEGWQYKWEITKEEEEVFRKYAIPLLKKVFHYNTSKAKQTFDFFLLDFGMKIIK